MKENANILSYINSEKQEQEDYTVRSRKWAEKFPFLNHLGFAKEAPA